MEHEAVGRARRARTSSAVRGVVGGCEAASRRLMHDHAVATEASAHPFAVKADTDTTASA